MQCQICHKEMATHPFSVKEMQLGILKPFEYIECDHCGCVQICTVPENMTDYYPDNYYSFNEKHSAISRIADKLRHHLFSYRMGHRNLIGYLFAHSIWRYRYVWMTPELSFDAKILDVGCCSGSLLKKLRQGEFRHLCGIDPFLKEDMADGNGLRILRQSIFQVNETFDYIMLHHSLEHMEQHKEVLEKVKESLNDKGTILVRIPCVGHTYRKHKENYYHLDAPRHFFLHSLNSFRLVCSSCGLDIDHFCFDTNLNGILGSERYASQRYGAIDFSEFSHSRIRKARKEMRQIDKAGEGDALTLYLKKKR